MKKLYPDSNEKSENFVVDFNKIKAEPTYPNLYLVMFLIKWKVLYNYFFSMDDQGSAGRYSYVVYSFFSKTFPNHLCWKECKPEYQLKSSVKYFGIEIEFKKFWEWR